MKKIFIIFVSLILFGLPALAFEYSAQEKKVFYDNFLKGMFWAMEQSLLINHVPNSKVKVYINAMKKRVNRQQLENETWSCVVKYSPTQLNTMSDKISKECFSKWADDYYTKNQDLMKLLK